MASECMVVATDCGGVKEIVGDEGLLAPAKNAESLARQIESALELTDDARASYGRAARQRIQERYSLDAAVEKWLALYETKATLL